MSLYARSVSMMDEKHAHGHHIGDGDGINDSPLQIFVQAKKSINVKFEDIESYVTETAVFANQIPIEKGIVTQKNISDIMENLNKVSGIREVLARDHMKVAFFGRTSNGKSTVINSMLKDKILPSGIGHTTSCFLQVEGSELPGEAFLVLEDSEERHSVESVGQLANALCKEKLTENSLVRIFWPKEKCPLLRDDVIFVDSPGIDVSPNLDEWIDKHCLDADVFVLVANSESTLMVTEKNFFHKVSTRLSKPNIFILNNRWDASASEPEFLDQVRAQHLERTSDFLVKELKVASKEQALERIFFVSAKEVLLSRLQKQKGPASPPPLFAEGFSARYLEFQNFERKFEECISKSAVKTKFEQHSHRGKHIVREIMGLLDEIFLSSHKLQAECKQSYKELWDKVHFTDKQLQVLTHEMKDKIRQMVEDVECKVSQALNEEIRRLGVLVDEFNAPFHSDLLVITVFKKELNAHVEQGLGSNLRGRLSTALAMNMESSQKEMTDRMAALLPVDKRSVSMNLLPRKEPFEVLYRLNCDNLCSDFKEDISFKFSFGLTALFNRILGRHNPRKPMPFFDGYKTDHTSRGLPLAPSTPMTPMNEFPFNPSGEDFAQYMRILLGACASQGTMGGLFVAGLLLKAVGWRVIAVTGIVYGGIYLYERLTWTNKAKEREFKRQYVDHATRKLRLIVDLTSANCSHQVQQELSSTFARLCHLVDSSTFEMESEIKELEAEITKLGELAAAAKIHKNKANYLTSELDDFDSTYLKLN